MQRFVYFDLGNVLVNFTIERLLEQGAGVTGCEIEMVRNALFAEGISHRYEHGEITEDEYYANFLRVTGVEPDRERLVNALCDIFTLNKPIIPALESLSEREFPRGILSNTGPGHWRHCRRNFPEIFERLPSNYILSYEVGAMKPSPKIYAAALKMAEKTVSGIQPEEIVFFDDLEANIEAAKNFGFDAVVYNTELNLSEEFTRRGIF